MSFFRVLGSFSREIHLENMIGPEGAAVLARSLERNPALSFLGLLGTASNPETSYIRSYFSRVFRK
jgi:hypothetical protein